MHTFTQKAKPAQESASAKTATPGSVRDVPSREVDALLLLQRTIGNQAVQRLFPVSPSAPIGIQAKLTVSTPGDIYEQEADRVAGMVMQEKGAGQKGIEEEDEPLKKSAVEKCSCGDEDKRVETKADVPRGGGRPLTPFERGFMEPRFGADFSAIRIHTGPEADTHNRALGARAFTVGGDIFFRDGEYSPQTGEGQRLLAHELTHSMQQGAAQPLDGAIVGTRTTVPLVQRQPGPAPAPPGPAPAPPGPAAPVAPPAGLAALNFLPVLPDAVPTGWGVTVNDDPVFDITAYANGATWSCVITKADQQSHQGTRLLPGVVEVTNALVAAEASCGTLQTMITSLNTVANQGADSGFYMLAAVQAHEDKHISQYRAGLAPHYATLKTTVEALTVPFAAHPDAAAAKAAIKALPAFTAAMATFHAGDVAVNNASGKHTPAAPFVTAEHGVVDPMIATIRGRRTALKCPP